VKTTLTSCLKETKLKGPVPPMMQHFIIAQFLRGSGETIQPGLPTAMKDKNAGLYWLKSP